MDQQAADDLFQLMALAKLINPTRARSDPTRSEWQKFLDQLSWLCDHRRAGASVCSIAVEEKLASKVYWFATASANPYESLSHLESMLRVLGNALPDNLQELEGEILKLSLHRAVNKIRDYQRRLHILLQKIKEPCEDCTEAEVELADRIETQLRKFGDRTYDVCVSAFQFRQTDLCGQLKQNVRSSPRQNIWGLISHFIGRLGSWHTASRYVVSYASRNRDSISNAEVMLVPEVSADIQQGERQVPALDHALHLTFPRYTLPNLMQQLALAASVEEDSLQDILTNIYRDHYGARQVHAELQMLLHFHKFKLQFARGDRYISCSKPSCYCCSMYMQLHPLDVKMRPSHGRVWMGWPYPLGDKDASERSSAQWLAFRARFTASIKQDIWQSILHSRRCRLYLRDSTTGITRSSELSIR